MLSLSKKKTTQITWLFVLLCTAISLYIKFAYRDYTFSDYTIFLSKWIEQLQLGGITSLKHPFYDYTPTYMYVLYIVSCFDINSLYLIKIISIFFEYICAFYIGRLAFMLLKTEWSKWLPFGIIPLLPSVVLNSAFMSQCDSIYVSFLIASIYYIFKKKQICGLLCLGLAFSLKFQSVMILPFYFVYMLRGHIKWYLFLSIPLVYVCTILPVFFMGRDFLDLLFQYANQVDSQEGWPLTLFFPNLYAWINTTSITTLNQIKIAGCLFVALSVSFGGYYLSKKRFVFTLKAWYTFLLFSVVFCSFFLPGMHERYMYLGDILAVLYVLVNYQKILSYLVAIFIVFSSWFSVVRTLVSGFRSDRSGFDFSFFNTFKYIKFKGISILLFILILYLWYDLFKEISNGENTEFSSVA